MTSRRIGQLAPGKIVTGKSRLKEEFPLGHKSIEGGGTGSQRATNATLYDVTEEPFSVRWDSLSDVGVHVRPLKHSDVTPRVLNEWKKGKVINSKDLKRFLARETTLVMKRGSRVLGIVNMREPFTKEMLYPEVVAVESNPRVREKVRGVGSALMAASIIVSKNWGYRGALQLVADQQAIEFYKKIGMSNTKRGQSSNKFFFTARAANRFLRAYERKQNKLRKSFEKNGSALKEEQQGNHAQVR